MYAYMCVFTYIYLYTNIYSYLETSGGQSSDLNAVHFFNTRVN